MLAKLKSIRDSEEGFTLIELLVVILIIGILAAIAIPAFLTQRQTANDGAVESDVKNASTQLETWVGEQMGANTKLPTDVLTKTNVKVSDGVTLTVSGTANAYCLLGFHSNGKKYTATTPATFDPSAGGLNRKGGTACLDGMKIVDGKPVTSAGAAAPNGSGIVGDGATGSDNSNGTNPEAGGETPVEIPLLPGQIGIDLVSNSTGVKVPAKLLVQKMDNGSTQWTVNVDQVDENGNNFTGSVGAKTTAYTCADGFSMKAGDVGFAESGIMLWFNNQTEYSTSFDQSSFYNPNGTCDLTSVSTAPSTFMVQYGVSGSNTFNF